MERKLDITERTFALYHRYGVGQVCYIFEVSSVHPITKLMLEDAMTILVNRHPLLRMCIVNRNGTLFWKNMVTRKMNIREDPSTEWQIAFSEGLSGGFDVENGPLWSLTLLPNAELGFSSASFEFNAGLLFRFSHSIIDGLGIISLMNDLQDLLVGDKTKLSQLSAALEDSFANWSRQFKRCLQKEMPTPLDDVAFQQATWFEKMILRTNVWNSVERHLIAPILSRKLSPKCTGAKSFIEYVKDESKCVSLDRARTEVCYDVIEKEVFMKIHDVCKKRGITIHSACQAAGDIALCEMITNHGRQRGYKSEISCPETLFVTPSHKKRLTETSEKENYVVQSAYLLPEQIVISECNDRNAFWERAHDIQVHNHEQLLGSMKQTCIANRQFSICLEDSDQFVKYFDPEKRLYLHGYTNHGNCNFINRNESAGIKVDGLVAGVSLQRYGGIVYHFLTTLDNKLIWNIVYPTNFTDREFVTNYLKRCIDILKHRCLDSI